MDMKHLNRSFPNLSLVAVLSVFAAGPAFSAPAAQAAPPSFKVYDSNGDGMLSVEEFRAQGGHEQAFREGDANRDNRLSKDEFVKASAYNDRLKLGKYVDDTWITAKVKAMLLKDEDVKGVDVNVETHKGMVQLSGWVNDPSQIAKAEKIATGVEGVKGIRNDLQLRR
jgi:hyperosmotically inducible protein